MLHQSSILFHPEIAGNIPPKTLTPTQVDTMWIVTSNSASSSVFPFFVCTARYHKVLLERLPATLPLQFTIQQYA